MAQVGVFASEQIHRLKDIGVFDIEIRQIHVAPVIVSFLSSGRVPFDEVVRLLVSAQTKQTDEICNDLHTFSS